MRDSEARRKLRSFGTFSSFDIADCAQPIHVRFEHHAARHPDAVAIRQISGDVTYAQLNAAANRAARALVALRGSAGQPVALMMPQGVASIVWTLAILKAGCCYAPLDQRLPAAVLREMVDDLDPAALLVAGCHFDLGRTIAAKRFPVVDIEANRRVDDAALPAHNLDRTVAPDDVAYVFYTSG